MAKAVWKISDRAADLENVPVKFDTATLEQNQIKRIIEGWKKDGIPEWAKRMIANGETISTKR